MNMETLKEISILLGLFVFVHVVAILVSAGVHIGKVYAIRLFGSILVVKITEHNLTRTTKKVEA